jgi:hypothetical protein
MNSKILLRKIGAIDGYIKIVHKTLMPDLNLLDMVLKDGE